MLAQNRWLVTVLIVLLVVLSSMSTLDRTGGEYLEGAFKRALLGFAIARGLNGVISVAQGTEFSLTPAGLGVNLAPGEILDPINDLVERFSWIMLLSSSALGVQQVLLSMSAWQGMAVILALFGVLLIILQWTSVQGGAALRKYVGQVFLILLILRFMMPLISLGNEWVYRTFLSSQYESASVELEQAREDIGQLNDEVVASPERKDSSIVDRAKQLYRSAISQVDFERKLEDYKVAAESISENTIRLIVVFIMQTVVFPLLFLWIMYLLIRRVLR